jgi:hypothetical protein
MRDFHPGEWCFDPYAKSCDLCETIVGRYAVLRDDDGLRHVLFWPHPEWDGVEGSTRCRAHTHITERWLRIV